MAPQKKSWRSQAQFFHQVDRSSATRTKRSTQNTEEKLQTSIVASPSLSRAWGLRASSAHPREAECDVASYPAPPKKRDCRRRASDDARRGPTPQRVRWTVTGPSLAGRLHGLDFCAWIFVRGWAGASPTLPGDEGISGWLSPPHLIFRGEVGSTCSRAR